MKNRRDNNMPWICLAVSALTFAGVTFATHAFPPSPPSNGSILAGPAAPAAGAFDEAALARARRANEHALTSALSVSQWESLRLLVTQHWRCEESGRCEFGATSLRSLALHGVDAGWSETLDRLRELQQTPGAAITALRLRAHGAALSTELTLTAACRKER
jgi:hypothetical protein